MSTKGTNNSFYEFQHSIEDAWDAADDEYMTNLVSVNVAQKTAQLVIERHRSKEQQKRQAPTKQKLPSSNSETNSSSNSQNSTGTANKPSVSSPIVPVPAKVAPGMGIRLNSTCSTSVTPPQRQKIDQQKLQKFRNLIQSPMTNLDELRTISWSGVPQEVRHTVWKLLCDYLPPSVDRRESTLNGKRTQYFNFVKQYFHMREGGQKMNSEMFLQIQKDLTRMNTLHGKPDIQKLFERVLFIWSMRHPASGYVQGINDLLTPYFIVFLSEFVNVDLNTAGELTLASLPTDEELQMVEADCFWCVSRLLDSIQDHYTFAQPGIQSNVSALARLIERMDRDLDRHIVDNKVEYLQFSFRWMNNLLMRELPLRCIIRLWDTYQAEKDGFSHFHLYVCAAFLLRFAKDLKRERDFQGLILMLQNLPTYHWTDEEINMLLAEAFRLQSLFAQAPNHLDKRK